MIKSIRVTNYLGDSIKLILREPERSGFLIKSIDGLGPTTANINTTDIATTDGSLFNSARLEQRNIVLDVAFVETPAGETIEDVRQKSYKYFPIKKKVELVVETDNRRLKTTGYVETNEPNIFSSSEGSHISIICPNPYFYTYGDEGTNSTVFYSIEPTFEFPFSNESVTDPVLILGEIQLVTDGVVIYTGDAEIGVTIYIHALGPARNISIHNLNTREIMEINSDRIETITGSGIIESDDIIIATTKGSKSIVLVREGVTYNILNCLGKQADWFQLTKGDNLFAFSAESGISNLQLRIDNAIIYEGV